MNRRDRRAMQKKLGINKTNKNVSLNEKFEKIRQNIISGKQKQFEMQENVRRQTNQSSDIELNNRISSLATTLMIQDGLEYIDALEKAKEQLNIQSI